MIFKPEFKLSKLLGGGGKTICPPPPPNIFMGATAPPPPRIDASVVYACQFWRPSVDQWPRSEGEGGHAPPPPVFPVSKIPVCVGLRSHNAPPASSIPNFPPGWNGNAILISMDLQGCHKVAYMMQLYMSTCVFESWLTFSGSTSLRTADFTKRP